MTKIVGTKFYGHDCGIFYIDTKENEIFGILTERVTRIKHDPTTIHSILNEYDFLKNIDYLAIPSIRIGGFDYYIIKYLSLYIKEKYNPKYRKEFEEIRKKIIRNKAKLLINNIYDPKIWKLFVAGLITKLLFRRDKKICWRLYHKLASYFIKKELSSLFNTKNISTYDHHLCHAASAYYFSPFPPKETLAFTLDGEGDEKYHTLYLFKDRGHKLISHSEAIH